MNADLIHAQPAQQAYAFSLALLVAVPFAKPHRPEAQHGLPAQARAARRGWFARLCSITPCQMWSGLAQEATAPPPFQSEVAVRMLCQGDDHNLWGLCHFENMKLGRTLVEERFLRTNCKFGAKSKATLGWARSDGEVKGLERGLRTFQECNENINALTFVLFSQRTTIKDKNKNRTYHKMVDSLDFDHELATPQYAPASHSWNWNASWNFSFFDLIKHARGPCLRNSYW